MAKIQIRIIAPVLLAIGAMGTALPSFAEYPDKPLTYIIAFNPGGASDLTARIQQKALEKNLGQDVNIVYKAGGGGAIAWSELIRTKPDGYTMAGHNIPHIVLQPIERSGKAGYETLDLKSVYFFESTPVLLLVKKDSKFKTLQDFVDYIKSQPAGAVTIGGSGSSTSADLGTALFNKVAGVKTTYVPFGGTGSAIPALLGGHVTALMDYSSLGSRYTDELRPLAIAADERMESLPDIPTFKELGYDMVEGAYRGVAVPPKTPEAVVNRLAEAFRATMDDPEVKKFMNENGYKIEHMGPEESEKLVKEKITEYTAFLKDAGKLK